MKIAVAVLSALLLTPLQAMSTESQAPNLAQGKDETLAQAAGAYTFQKQWMPAAEGLTASQKEQLQDVYQQMMAGRFTEAEQRLEALHKQTASVLPLWISLLTETQQFEKIRQLVADGLIPTTHNSAAIARLYTEGGLPSLRFAESNASVPLESHFLVSLPRVKIDLNGQTYYFVLDTGASQSLVTDRVVEALKLKTEPGSKVTIDTATDNKVTADLIRMPEFKLGPVVAANQLALVVQRDELEQRLLGVTWYQLDGIIGWPILKQLDLTFDFDRKELEIRKPVESKRRGNLVWLFDDPMVITNPAEQPRLWFLDSGAMNSVLTADYLSPQQTKMMEWETKKFDGLGGEGAEEKVGELGPVNIAFPSYTQIFKQITVRAGHADCVHSRCDGRLGVDIAKKRRMHINFQAGSFDVGDAVP